MPLGVVYTQITAQEEEGRSLDFLVILAIYQV